MAVVFEAVRAGGNTGIVESNVEPSGLFLDPRDKSGHQRLFRHVDMYRVRLASALQDQFARLGEISLTATCAIYGCAACGERQ